MHVFQYAVIISSHVRFYPPSYPSHIICRLFFFPSIFLWLYGCLPLRQCCGPLWCSRRTVSNSPLLSVRRSRWFVEPICPIVGSKEALCCANEIKAYLGGGINHTDHYKESKNWNGSCVCYVLARICWAFECIVTFSTTRSLSHFCENNQCCFRNTYMALISLRDQLTFLFIYLLVWLLLSLIHLFHT